MSDQDIINCHIHTFTNDHTPKYYPHPVFVVFRWVPGLVRVMRRAAWFMPWAHWHSFMVRIEAFHRSGNRKSQAAIFDEIQPYYPQGTKFVVLPLDMAPIGHGPVGRDIRHQHDELAELAGRYPEAIIPFANVHPDNPIAAEEFRRCVEDLGFRGLKLYPKMGFAPDHPVLMEEVYPLCADKKLPVITHCSRGGVARKGWGKVECDRVTAPFAYKPVLERFSDLRICLAHYGGDQDWENYIDKGFHPDNPAAKEGNWLWQINEMLTCGDYDNLWTDISYTIFRYNKYAPLLRLLLTEKVKDCDRTILDRVLFGSDFYMTRQESLSEKAVSIRLRVELGEDVFTRIAKKNPLEFLGLPEK